MEKRYCEISEKGSREIYDLKKKPCVNKEVSGRCLKQYMRMWKKKA